MTTNILKVIFVNVVNWGKNCSIAGFSHICKSCPNALRALYWLAVFVLGMYYTALGMYDVIQDFHKYPIVTTTDLSHRPSITFPAVTLCNLNRVHCAHLITQYRHFYDETQQSNESKAIDQRNFHVLKRLLDKTQCVDQVCAVIEEKQFSVRDAEVEDPEELTEVDRMTVLQPKIGCPTTTGHRNKNCHFLLHMFEEKNGTSRIQPQANHSLPKNRDLKEAWDYYGCDLQKACIYDTGNLSNMEKKHGLEVVKPVGCDALPDPVVSKVISYTAVILYCCYFS